MAIENAVEDGELVLRRVRTDDTTLQDGVRRISVNAFYDSKWEVSVDRASMFVGHPCAVQPPDVALIAGLLVRDVRAMKELKRDAKGREAGFVHLDVKPDPIVGAEGIPANAAHALIVASGDPGSRASRRLRQELADQASIECDFT